MAPSAAIDLAPVLDEPLYPVGARRRPKPGRLSALLGPRVTLATVAKQPLVIPSRPHSVRMLLQSALAKQG